MHRFFAGKIPKRESMFAITRNTQLPGRKRRQVIGPSLNSNPPQPFSIENLNYTDEQREFCNNITECMFDLLITGDTEIAGNTMDAVMESNQLTVAFSKEYTLS